ncbi:MAG TPA: hypothetical protein VMT29_18670 [Steroidobacteraceae bacterium]|nr:hypothetical protein [Steroidobacteraceae bacterium]
MQEELSPRLTAHTPHVRGSADLPILLSWPTWQRAVLSLLRVEFAEHHIGFDEVDWLSWRLFYDAGKTPAAAIDRALERDF